MDDGLRRLADVISDLDGQNQVCPHLAQVLRPLITYDARTGADLTLTLRTYVENIGNLTATSERLFLHRNSVGYRLQRIQELTGIDPRERATLLLLLLAFAITDRSMLETPILEGADEDQCP